LNLSMVTGHMYMILFVIIMANNQTFGAHIRPLELLKFKE